MAQGSRDPSIGGPAKLERERCRVPECISGRPVSCAALDVVPPEWVLHRVLGVSPQTGRHRILSVQLAWRCEGCEADRTDGVRQAQSQQTRFLSDVGGSSAPARC